MIYGDLSILHLLLLLPVLGVLAILLGAPGRLAALVSTTGLLIGSVVVFVLLPRNTPGFHFVTALPITPLFDMALRFGVDGLSATMLLLSGLVGFAAIAATPSPSDRVGTYYACLLLILAGAVGAFISLDLFFLYAFHELALVPTFLLIGIWGHGNKTVAAWRATLFLGLGSFVLLIGLLAMILALPKEAQTFDLVRLAESGATGSIPAPAQSWIYLLQLAGFGALVSLVPLHSWAPHAYASAPAPAAMLHAGILKKFGLYGLLRISQPMLPEGAASWLNLLLVLLCLNVVYIGFVTIAQRKLDLMLGHSSVMHMGYIFLGVACFAQGPLGPTGAAFLMLAHGLVIAILFGMAGDLRSKFGTLEIAELGGLATRIPRFSFLFILAAFASIGLPGFANFTGEIMVFAAGFQSQSTAGFFSPTQLAVIFTLSGVLLSAIYMLRVVGNVFFGPLNEELGEKASEITLNGRLVYAMLLAALLVAGIFPGLFIPALQSVFGH